MEELRLSLLIMGGCLILAILAHGIWSIRKNKANDTQHSQRLEPRNWEQDDAEIEEWEAADSHTVFDVKEDNPNSEEGFDELGLGQVRVVQHTAEEHEVIDTHPEPEAEQAEVSVDAAEEQQDDKLYGSVVSNPKPHMVTESRSQTLSNTTTETKDMPEPPASLLKQTDEGSVTPEVPASPTPPTQSTEQQADDTVKVDTPEETSSEVAAEQPPESEKPGLAEQARRLVARNKPRRKGRTTRKEPNFGEDQMRIDFDEPVVADMEPMGTGSGKTQQTADNQQPAGQQQEVLVLSVKAAEDKPIPGAALLPMLLTLGFKFGDQDIFHRHVNSNGKGPVLFSLANMFKPGVFDIDNLENFTTQGISLFMILPIEGDPHQVFNMMHNAARKIADEFGAQVLDGTRSVLTKQSLQQYVEKIREFERQRMINRNKA